MDKIFSKYELQDILSETQRLNLDEKSINNIANQLANFKKSNKIHVNPNKKRAINFLIT
jgi:hypothetical protein